MQKQIKDAYPKKVCHMLKHVKNKRCIPKEGMSHAHKACKKTLIQEKNNRDGSCKEVNPPCTKNIHTLAHINQGL